MSMVVVSPSLRGSGRGSGASSDGCCSCSLGFGLVEPDAPGWVDKDIALECGRAEVLNLVDAVDARDRSRCDMRIMKLADF